MNQYRTHTCGALREEQARTRDQQTEQHGQKADQPPLLLPTTELPDLNLSLTVTARVTASAEERQLDQEAKRL